MYEEKSYWTNLCNLCFMPYEKCNCVNKRSIGVDSNIAIILRLLHLKKYQTVSCCEGHIRVYKTKKGNVYTSYSPLYVTFDSHSLRDMQEEIKDWKNFSLEILDDNRYQINSKGFKAKGDKREEAKYFKNEIIKELSNNIIKMKVRKWGKDEKVIQTSY